MIQWSSMQGTPLTVAGAARAFNPSSLSIPVRGTCRKRERCLKARGESTVTERDLVKIVAHRRSRANQPWTSRAHCAGHNDARCQAMVEVKAIHAARAMRVD